MFCTEAALVKYKIQDDNALIIHSVLYFRVQSQMKDRQSIPQVFSHRRR